LLHGVLDFSIRPVAKSTENYTFVHYSCQPL
jgi:hypothetical protein